MRTDVRVCPRDVPSRAALEERILGPGIARRLPVLRDELRHVRTRTPPQKFLEGQLLELLRTLPSVVSGLIHV